MPQKFLSVKNFEKFQHFKKPNPPWIKLYRSILTDREFIQLPTTAKYIYLGLILLASEGCNKIFNDPSWISHRLAIKVSELDLKPLYQAGFLIASQSTVYRESIATQSTNCLSETENRDRERGEGEADAPIPSAPPPIMNGKPKGKRPISDEDKPTEKHFSLGQQLGVNVGPEWGKFKNYCLAHDKRYANFEAAFRNWIVNAPNMNGGKHVVR